MSSSNVALIFAGGTGQRMNTKTRPKQFLELHGKPIIIYTLEQFEDHPQIDGIVVVCLEPWIPFLKKLLKRFEISKIVDVVPGGENSQDSIRHGVYRIAELYDQNSVVLVHDGVRPLVDATTISACIEKTNEHGNAITVTPSVETIVTQDGDRVVDIIDRNDCVAAKAPQAFVLSELKDAHDRAVAQGKDDFIDSASLMRHYGYDLYTVPGSPENIKITTPSDFYVFRALADAHEDSQIFGL